MNGKHCKSSFFFCNQGCVPLIVHSRECSIKAPLQWLSFCDLKAISISYTAYGFSWWLGRTSPLLCETQVDYNELVVIYWFLCGFQIDLYDLRYLELQSSVANIWQHWHLNPLMNIYSKCLCSGLKNWLEKYTESLEWKMCTTPYSTNRPKSTAYKKQHILFSIFYTQSLV